MKKVAGIALIAMTTLVIAGCGKKGLTAEQTACMDSIQAYLAETNTNITETTVESGDLVTVDYIGRHSDHEIFDTSIQSVAEGCDGVTPGRNYEEGLSFVVGAGRMISGFEKAVREMKVGETKTVILSPEDAYGERSEDNLIEMKKSDLPEGEWKKGDELPTFFGPMPITAVTDETVTIDTNPPLAGKTLTFDITVKSVQDADTVELPSVDEEVAGTETEEDTAEMPEDGEEPTEDTGETATE